MNKIARGVLLGISLCFASTAIASNIQHIEVCDSKSGVVHVKYQSNKENTKIKLLIQKDGIRYSYNLKNAEEYESFVLQLGNGKYQIGIYENITGNRYRLIESKEANVDIETKEEVFLNSIQNIKWEDSSEAVLIAKELVKDIEEDMEKVKVIYNYILKEYSYDYDKFDMLPYDYLPDIQQLLSEKKGICYDLASLFAIMLRSQGIPTKLIMGYHPEIDIYHSWNEVYDAEQGIWHTIDVVYDMSFRNNNMFKDQTVYTKSREY